MEIFSQEFEVPQEGLSARRLFWMLQEVSGSHSRSIGYGEDDMRALGVMWVVVRYGVTAERWPRAGERVRAETWPGQTRHGMCPRFYRLRGESGSVILSGSSLWAVVDRETRQMVVPHERGVDIEPQHVEGEAKLPATIRRPATDRETDFTVPEEYLDGNGHMNNTCYFDLAEQCTGLNAARSGLREVQAEYLNEALLGERMRVLWGSDGDWYTVVGEADAGHVFRMRLRCAQENR